MMNTKTLAQELKKYNITPGTYSIIGETEPPETEQYVLTKDGTVWAIFYAERGERIKEKHFEVEDEACRYFLNWLITEPGVAHSP